MDQNTFHVKSVDHLANPRTAEVEESKLSQTQFADLASEVSAHYRILDDLHEDVEHKPNRHHDLTSTLQSHRVDLSDDRAQFAFSLVENDREHRALCDELRLARRDIAMLQDQHQILVRDQKNLLGILEHFGGGLSSLS